MKYHTIGLAAALAIAYGTTAMSASAQEIEIGPHGPRIELPHRHHEWRGARDRRDWRDRDDWRRHREWRRWHHHYDYDEED